MNARIPPPQQPITDPDVTLECERAIDGAVRELVDHAVVAGWPPEAAFEAIKRAAGRQAMAYHGARATSQPAALHEAPQSSEATSRAHAHQP